MNAKEKLKVAGTIAHNISQNEQTIRKINLVLNDYDNHRMDISVMQSQNRYGFSFGAKKYNIKKEMSELLSLIKQREEEELEKNNIALEEIMK